MSARGFLLLFCLLAFPSVGLANDTPAEKCATGSAAWQDARKNIDTMDRLVEMPSTKAEALEAALVRVLDGPCAAQEVAPSSRSTPFSGLTLRTWWHDGGKKWAQGPLDDPQTLIFAPSFRRELSLDVAPTDSLARLLCHGSDLDCGRETLGWVHRAHQSFALTAQEGQHSERSETLDLLECSRAAGLEVPDNRYSRWVDCVSAVRVAVPAFPVGRFRIPREGWFIIQGRRGHYSFCDEARAYDLASGAAYVASSCSGLVLRPDGTVDREKTRARRQSHTEAGRLLVDNLREAVWMILFADQVENGVYLRADYFSLPPPPVERRTSGRQVVGKKHAGEILITTAQTPLKWSWVVDGQVAITGELTWPGTSEAGNDHAAELLSVAEASFVPGCPATPLPRAVAAKCVSPRHADPSEPCDDMRMELLRNLEQFTCAPSGQDRSAH